VLVASSARKLVTVAAAMNSAASAPEKFASRLLFDWRCETVFIDCHLLSSTASGVPVGVDWLFVLVFGPVVW
jgi:hypothetical protein